MILIANRISLNDLSKTIEKEVRNWTKDIVEDIDDIKKDVTKSGIKQLRASSPRRTGDYAKNWTSKKLKNGDQIIYQKAPTYRLTHVLEKGHAKRDGGRVAPQVHIAPVEEQVTQDFVSRVEKRLGQ
ncbi:HK97 gp10 family phage protein [Lactococcus formosensis]|uniref:HK97 gp10 family phage protein n=1 Tax=Lactococcus formosensis TaxID=1281486 RepID=UPI003264138E